MVSIWQSHNRDGRHDYAGKVSVTATIIYDPACGGIFSGGFLCGYQWSDSSTQPTGGYTPKFSGSSFDETDDVSFTGTDVTRFLHYGWLDWTSGGWVTKSHEVYITVKSDTEVTTA